MSGTALLPCPFCGAKGDIFTDGKRTWGLVEHNDGCLFPSFRKHEIPECDFEAWNTRSVTAAAVMGYEAAQAERTCKREKHGTKMDGSPKLRCSLCGYGIGDKRWKFCPNCGARAVDDAES